MMYRRPEEIAELKASFRRMDVPHKIEYIYTYYKWFILLGLAALIILGNALHRHLTQKDVTLYLGLTNVSVGTELEQELTSDFLAELGLSEKKYEVLVYSGLYLSENPAGEDHQYAYASRMKIMATVNAKKLDVVLMNRESYDLLSASGFLLDLSGQSDILEPWLTENDVVLEDNMIDVQLNTAEEHVYVTETATNGMDISELPLFRDAGFDGAVYAGILANCPRTETAIIYLEYLCKS